MGVISIFVVVVFVVLSIIFFVIPQLESYDIIEGVRGGRGGGGGGGRGGGGGGRRRGGGGGGGYASHGAKGTHGRRCPPTAK